MISNRPADRQQAFDFGDEADVVGVSEPQRGESDSAVIEQPALDHFHEVLMEKIVDRPNMERAWKNVRANRGAPGPDGITVAAFPEWFRSHWDVLRQQLLEGTYHPGPARRVSIPKPDGGERHLAAFSWKRAKRGGPLITTGHPADPDSAVRS